MPVQTVVIKVTQDSSEVVKLVDTLERLGVIDKENARQFRQTEQQFNQGQRRTQQNIRQTNRELENAGRTVGSLDRAFRNLAATVTVALSVQQVVRFTKSIIDAQAQVEYTQVAFETLLGSASKASKLMKDLADFAARTPFTIPEVENAAKQLLAYGFQANKIIDVTRRLGDVSAALSIPLNDIIYLYGTTRVQGRLYTRDLIQFTTRGIDLTAALAEQFKVSESSVRALVESGKVGFPEVEKAFTSMTNEGGLFFDLMQKQSKTTGGQISNLEDDFIKLKRELGEELAPTIRSIVAGLRDFVQGLDPKDIIAFAKFVLLAVQALVSYKLVSKAAALTQKILNRSLGDGAIFMGKFAGNIAKAVPIIGTVISVVGLATAAYELFSNETDDLTDKQKELEDQLIETTRELNKQRKVLGNVSEASLQDLKDTEQLIQSQLEQLSKEGIRKQISAEIIKGFSPDKFSEIVNQGGEFDDPITALFAEANKSVTDEAINTRFNEAKKTLLTNLDTVQKEIAKRQKEILPPDKDAENAAKRKAKFEQKMFNEFIESLFDKDNAEREISEESLKRAKLRNREEFTDSEQIRLADLNSEIRYLENLIELNIFTGEKLVDIQLQIADKKQSIRDLELQMEQEMEQKRLKLAEETQRKYLDILKHRADISQEISDRLTEALIFNEQRRIAELVRGGTTIEEAERQVAEERQQLAENFFKSTLDIILKELQAVLQAAIFESFAKSIASGIPLPLALIQATAKTAALTAAFSTARAGINTLTFHEGTDYVPGGGGLGLRGDESYAKLQQGEGVARKQMNLKYKGLVKAINEDRAFDWFVKQPRMNSKDIKTLRNETLANSMIESILNQDSFDDKNITKNLKDSIKSDRINTEYLAKVIRESTRVNYRGVGG